MNLFSYTLRNITSVSYTYADAAWFTLDDKSRENPAKAAYYYAKRFLIN